MQTINRVIQTNLCERLQLNSALVNLNITLVGLDITQVSLITLWLVFLGLNLALNYGNGNTFQLQSLHFTLQFSFDAD